MDLEYDVIGIGYGPSNLALAVAIEEHNQKNNNKIKSLFLEKKEKFDWHPGMLLPDSYMQISFPKDLVTYRNPRSKYTFLNYLFEKNRLVDFVNLNTFYPSRQEFRDYLSWVALNVNAKVNYSCNIDIINENNNLFEIKVKNNIFKSKNIAFGLGLTPKFPKSIKPSIRIFHNHNILNDIKKINNFAQNKIAILGAGQSAAEVINYLYSQFPKIEVHAIFSNFGLTPSDSSPYNNKIFNPETVDQWYNSKNSIKNKLFNQLKTTNYSCVNEDLINKIYYYEYHDSINNNKRIFLHNTSKIVECKEFKDFVKIKIKNSFNKTSKIIKVDALICATGFKPSNFKKLLANENNYEFKNELPITNRYYKLKNKNSSTNGIYLNGGTEHSHGLSSSLLSVTSLRVQEILNSILKNQFS